MLRLLRLWRMGGRDLRLLWFAMRHPLRPQWLIPAVALLGVFAFEPANFALPLLGFVDDVVLLPLLLHGLIRILPVGVRDDFDRRSATRVR